MTEAEKKALAEQIGKQTTEALDKATKGLEEKAKSLAEEAVKNAGGITVEKFNEYKAEAEIALKEAKEAAEKQGTTLQEISAKLSTSEVGSKSIAQTLADDADELKTLHKNRTGVKEYILNLDGQGRPVMKALDRTNPGGVSKTAGPHATVGNVGAAGNTASIAQSLGAATLLRVAGMVPIVGQFRNTPWLFNLLNVTNASFENMLAIWMEEQIKQGSSATVAEGDTKPAVQYSYVIRSSEYRKEAQLLSFTDEFRMDFEQLQSDILGRGLIDLQNRINADILPRVIAAATAYNTGTQFKAGEVVPNANDLDAIVAMAAQSKNATFGSLPNGAVMSTFKEGRMAITKDTTGAYLNRPEYLRDLSFIGNPDMATNNVVVGDFTNYNVILRGGIIVRVGYNADDFARNKFSVVQEQYYYDWISATRTPALVKGPDFATVKTAISS